MIEVLALTNFTVWLFVGAGAAVVGNMVFFKKVLDRLNTDPLEERSPVSSPLADAAESTREEGIRTNVAAPRPRRLAPVPPAAEAPEAVAPEVAAPPRSVKLNVLPPKETELAEPVLASALTTLKETKPADLPAKDEKSETPVPVGALILGSTDAGTKVPTVPPVPAVEAKEATAPSSQEKLLPPTVKPAEIQLTGRKFFEPPLPTASLVASANPPSSGALPLVPADHSKKDTALPPLSSVVPTLSKAEKTPSEPVVGPAASAVSREPESKPPVGRTFLKPTEPASTAPAPAIAPKIEQAGEGLLAVSGPAKATGGSDLPPVSAEADDVKKKTPPIPAPEPVASAGLILIAPADSKPEPATAKAAETPTEPAAAKPAEAPAAPAAKTEAPPAFAKAPPEPMLSPAVADAPPTPKPEVEAKAIKGPRVFLPGKFFGRGSKDKEAAEAKAANEAAEVKAAAAASTAEAPEAPRTVAESAKAEPEPSRTTTPASAPIIPPVEQAPAAAEAKQDVLEDKPAAKVEEPEAAESAAKAPELVKPTSEPATVPTPEAPASKQSQPAGGAAPAPEAKPAPEPPVAKSEPEPAAPVAEKAAEPVAAPTAKAPEPPVAEPVPPEPEPVEEKSVASAPEAEKAPESSAPALPEPAAVAKPTASLTVPPPLPTQAAPTTEPIAEPLVSMVASSPQPAEVPAPANPVAPAAPAPAAVTPPPTPPIALVAPIIQTHPVMPPTDTTTSLPNNGRASAQLTLGFEITSLQLTPFFKLGSVQLKALSNVVSLHLVAAQADNPLAAGISFQIDHVDLDGASHLRSILLKPLGESRTVTAPLPKLQVDNVAITGGGEGAPISVTTSEQASTAVQLFGTFTIAAMDFTPAFEIGSLRLEPTSNTVLLRVAPSSRPTALDLPPSFEVAAVQLGDGAQIAGMRVTPSGAKPS